MPLRCAAWVVLSMCAAGIAPAARADEPADAGAAPSLKTPGMAMDYGPVLSSSLSMTVEAKPRVIAYKSLNIKLSSGASIAFDTDLLRYSAAWTGGWLNLAKTHMTTSKGSVCPRVEGKVVFSTQVRPGVSHAGRLADPRTDPAHPHLGPLPKEFAHYRGMYLNGERVVLAYSAGGGTILELPGATRVGDAIAFTRTLHVEKTTEPLTFVLADDPKGISAELIKAPVGAAIQREGDSLYLTIPAISETAVFEVAIGQGKIAPALQSLGAMIDPATLIAGGPPRWKESVHTVGRLNVSAKSPRTKSAGEADFPYVLDTLTLPDANPWSSWIRPGAFDFFPDGKSAAVATWNGDVWIVSGIDPSLANLQWKRFATGLYEPLGLKIVNDEVYTLGRDQITRLHDLNHDGEADYYENFNNDGITGDHYHLFKFDLDTDAAGNFYYSIVGAWATNELFSSHGKVAKVSADGSKLTYIGSGLRAANGLAVGPAGEIVLADNQGHWMPSSKINFFPPGKTDGFYGFTFDPRIEKQLDLKRLYPAGPPSHFDPPLCWIPYAEDNSSGGQVYGNSDQWGPFKGHFIHSSYGQSTIFLVMHELVDGVAQGGVWRFPLTFDSGVMRLRFNPGDGQLYGCGLRGWQTSGASDGCLQRVRYTGKPVYRPIELHASRKGISITFTASLDPATATDVNSYDIEQWNYKWSAAYGSAEYSVSNPGKKGHDTLDIQSARLQPDGKTVFLEIPTITPVMQMAITYKLKASDGHPVEGTIYNTVNILK